MTGPTTASEPLLVAVMGPTASGKTALAEAMADATGYQLINADAFQVYRGMDIGTAKSGAKDRYLLIDVLDPWDEFGCGAWIRLVCPELEALYKQRRGVIIVGGTLYYIRALLENYQELHEAPDLGLREEQTNRSLDSLVTELKSRSPQTAESVDLRNRVRVQRALERLDSPKITFTLPPFRKLKLGLSSELDPTMDPIRKRVDDMVERGWVDEVRALEDRGVGRNDPGMRAHGYRAMWDVAHNCVKLEDAIEATAVEVRQYAKRQRTWLRKEPNLVKLPTTDEGSALATALKLLWEDS